MAKTLSRSPVKAILGASSGNLVEWYDFYAYSFTSIYFGPAFFPSGDSTSQLLKTAGIFAVGFFMRPLGSWFFGQLADRKGRRASLIASVLLMSAGSLLIALLPTYAQVGGWAPLGLLVARLLQGLSVGGEYGTSATYMSEVAGRLRRGFYSSFQYVTLIGGQLLAVLVVLLLQKTLSHEQLLAWGWRIPFLLGALAALVALGLRSSLHETRPEQAHPESGSLAALWKHRRACLLVCGFTAGGSLIFYTYTTYMQKYLVLTAGFAEQQASQIMTAVLFTFMLMQPFFGAFSDRVGRRACMLAFGCWALLTTYPLLYWIGQCRSGLSAYLLLILGLAGVSLYTSVSGIVKAELFPVQVRALGVGLCYALSNATFGGTAEFVALQFKQWHLEKGFFLYVTGMGLISLVVAWHMPKTVYLQGEDSH